VLWGVGSWHEWSDVVGLSSVVKILEMSEEFLELCLCFGLYGLFEGH